MNGLDAFPLRVKVADRMQERWMRPRGRRLLRMDAGGVVSERRRGWGRGGGKREVVS